MKQLDMFEDLIPKTYEYEELPHDYWASRDEILATMKESCMFDSFRPTEGKTLGLSCPCPKCSPRC